MNIYDHCRLSVRKFGGDEMDYYHIHKFMDSSKLFYFNPKHRLLLHNLYGIELTVRKHGDVLINADQRSVLVRDIAAEHCREDMSGRVPGLEDWLKENDEYLSKLIEIPEFNDDDLEQFVLTPLFRSNLKSSLLITLSNFGVHLVNEFLGLEKAKVLSGLIQTSSTVPNFLRNFCFTKRWQYTPCPEELEWIANNNMIKKKN